MKYCQKLYKETTLYTTSTTILYQCRIVKSNYAKTLRMLSKCFKKVTEEQYFTNFAMNTLTFVFVPP